MNVKEVSAIAVDAAFHLHHDLGPGLLESVYEAVLARMLERRGLRVERQKAIVFDFDGIHFDEGLRVNLFAKGCLVVNNHHNFAALRLRVNQGRTRSRKEREGEAGS